MERQRGVEGACPLLHTPLSHLALRLLRPEDHEAEGSRGLS